MYYQDDFEIAADINLELFQMSKISSSYCHIINVYRSHGADTALFLHHLESLVRGCDECYIVGDFNINLIKHNHPIVAWILAYGFKQLVQSPTHEEGGILDHAYVKSKSLHHVFLHWPYYSDHAAVCIKKEGV